MAGSEASEDAAGASAWVKSQAAAGEALEGQAAEAGEALEGVQAMQPRCCMPAGIIHDAAKIIACDKGPPRPERL